jgi:uncharacterized protein (TIGR02246 family)
MTEREAITMVTARHFERPAIERFVRAWQDAFDRGDYEALAAAYADEAVVNATGMPALRGRDAIVEFWRTVCEGAKLAGIQRTVHTDQYDSCGDLAYLQGTVTLTANSHTTVAWYVTVWKRCGEREWKIVADTSTVVAHVHDEEEIVTAAQAR